MFNSIEVTISWLGPFSDPALLVQKPGLYAMTGHVYGDAGIRLLYIGKAENDTIAGRWTCRKHRDWLDRSARHLSAKLYAAAVDRPLIDDLESVLIYVHQPNQNSSKKNKTLPRQRFLIHNVGAVPEGMLKDVDSGAPWFGILFDGETCQTVDVTEGGHS